MPSYRQKSGVTDGGELLIVGAGGLTRETLELVAAANAHGAAWTVTGVLDDDPSLHGKVIGDVTVLGPSALVHEHPDARVVLCLGSPASPAVRRDVAVRLDLAPERYATLVHPDACLAASTEVGAGSIVLAGVISTADVRIGRGVVVMPATVLTHDDALADYVTVAAGVRIAGSVVVQQSAYLGAGSLLREGIAVGALAVVGMGSVVLSDIPAGEVWAGVPARRIR